MLVRWLGAVIGVLLLAGGIGAVLFIDWNPPPPPPPELIRPVKTAPIRNALAMPERQFPGVVQPGRTVDLAFQVSGPLVEAALELGRVVREGDVLARIDPVRFEQDVAALQPEVSRTRQERERIRGLVDRGVASDKERQDADVAYEAAVAQLTIAEQRVQDTILRAPFDALVVQRFAEESENVQAAQPVARLQNITAVDIAVDLPENVVALSKGRQSEHYAVFPFAPQQRFPVAFKEASAEADPQSLTYRVIFTLSAPEDYVVLPGMTASIVSTPAALAADETRFLVPTAAIFADAEGQSCLWAVSGQGEPLHVQKATIEIMGVLDVDSVIRGDIREGQPVVVAGTSLLRDGQAVRLLEDRRR